MNLSSVMDRRPMEQSRLKILLGLRFTVPRRTDPMNGIQPPIRRKQMIGHSCGL